MISDTVANYLLADSTLMTTLTGGVYVEKSEGRNGISRQSVPGAYSDDGYLIPCVLVNFRNEHPWGGGHDSAAQYKSLRDLLEIYLYDDGDNTYDAIETAALRVETLLDEKRIAGVAGAFKTLNRLVDREPSLENALMIRLDFQFVRGQQLSA